MPTNGVQKAPATPDNPRVGKRLKQYGEEVGINFTGKCDRYPNSTLSHCLLTLAEEKKGWSVQNEIQEELFKAYFTDGVYPDSDMLLKLAKKHNIPVTEKDLNNKVDNR
eukprot:UN13291